MSGPARIWFDESLPALVKGIVEQLGKETLEQGLILRDTSGRLRFLSRAPSPANEVREQIDEKLAFLLVS